MSQFEHVVIVDDELDHAVISRLVLAQVAPEVGVETFTDLKGLGARLAEVTPRSLVVMDRMLNGTESFGLIEQLKAARPDLTIVLVSAVLSAHDHQRAVEVGATLAAEKPGDLIAWRAFFTDLLGRRPAASGDSAVA
jgi:DNA-binding response OmpR family regulator